MLRLYLPRNCVIAHETKMRVLQEKQDEPPSTKMFRMTIGQTVLLSVLSNNLSENFLSAGIFLQTFFD